MNKPFTALFALAVAGCALGLARQASTANSPTVDEVPYLQGGYDIFAKRDFTGVANGGVAPLPLLLAYWPMAFDRELSPESVDPSGPRAVAQVLRGRLAQGAVLLPLLLVTLAWFLHGRYGWPFALVGCSLVALSPAALAHSAVAATDFCFMTCGVLFIVAGVRYLEGPSPGRLLLVALALGLVLAAKYTAVLFLLVLALCLLVTNRQRGAAALWGVTRPLLVCAAVAFVVCWGLHGFQLVKVKEAGAAGTPPGSPWRRVLGGGATADRVLDFASREPLCPAPLKGLLKQTAMVGGGGDVYLCGRVYHGGTPLYYPVAFAVKSSPAELALLGAAFVALLLLVLRPAAGRRRPDAVPLVAGATLVLFFLVMSFSRKQLGLRYLLIVYPLAFLLAAELAHCLPRRDGVGAALAAAAVLLVLLQASSACAAMPYPLAYFNRLAGGAREGARYLDDSNLDWGQGLVALSRYQSTSARGASLGLIYHGSLSPRAYGIETVALGRLLDGPGPGGYSGRRLLGVSATMLCRDRRLRSLAGVPPVERAAFSIYVYDLEDPAVFAALKRYLAAEKTGGP
jgi:hypothetical protein